MRIVHAVEEKDAKVERDEKAATKARKLPTIDEALEAAGVSARLLAEPKIITGG